MNIVDALIQKGSTGGNNIAEAVENLPDISGGGSGSDSGSGGEREIFTIHLTATQQGEMVSDATYEDIVSALTAEKIIFVYSANSALCSYAGWAVNGPKVGFRFIGYLDISFLNSPGALIFEVIDIFPDSVEAHTMTIALTSVT